MSRKPGDDSVLQKQIVLRISDTMDKRLTEAAARYGQPRSEWLRSILTQIVESSDAGLTHSVVHLGILPEEGDSP